VPETMLLWIYMTTTLAQLDFFVVPLATELSMGLTKTPELGPLV